eukprot:1152346-Pelagomonas_calceolata.AAC.16
MHTCTGLVCCRGGSCAGRQVAGLLHLPGSQRPEGHLQRLRPKVLVEQGQVAKRALCPQILKTWLTFEGDTAIQSQRCFLDWLVFDLIMARVCPVCSEQELKIKGAPCICLLLLLHEDWKTGHPLSYLSFNELNQARCSLFASQAFL